jgi:uncharacterized membrane protein
MNRARDRVLLAALVGLVVFAVVVTLEPWEIAILSGWNAAAVMLITWTLVVVWWKDGTETARIATRVDDSRATADLLLVSASIASLAGIGFGLVKAAREGGPLQGTLTGFAVLSVILSWLMVQTVYILRYARLYYGEGGGVDFNEQKNPDYRDFAYLAFTIGMTYQVSDTNLTSTSIRRTALHHAVLSFVFGTSIIAMMINVVAGLLNR